VSSGAIRRRAWWVMVDTARDDWIDRKGQFRQSR
jgi:hypothetical protein